MRTYFWKEIVAAATKYALDPVLVEAVAVQESSGNADAFRFEREFWNRYLKPNKLYAGRNPRRVSSSYGLLQVMYPVAVERGFPADLHPELLFVPETALEYGCRHLRYLTDKMETKFPSATSDDKRLAILASYNGGFQGPDALRPRNKAYAQSVLATYALLLKERAGS